MEKKKVSWIQIVGAALMVVAIGLFVWAIVGITSSEYKDYKEQYSECMRNYNNALYEASQSEYFTDSWNTIADKYLEVAHGYRSRMSKYETRSYILIGVGVACTGAGIAMTSNKIKRKEK